MPQASPSGSSGTSGSSGAAPERASLLYAGRDMRLATAGELLNEQSEIRAEGDMRIVDADGRAANSVRNVSGSMAAGGSLSIRARTLENVRATLNIRRDATSWRGDCWDDNFRWGDRKERWWDFHEVTHSEDRLLAATPAGSMTAAGDVFIEADSVRNAYSHLAAGRDMVIRAESSLTNVSTALYRNYYETIYHFHDDEDGDKDKYAADAHITRRTVLTPYSASVTAGGTLRVEGAALQNLADMSDATPLTDRDPAALAEIISALTDGAMFRPVSGPGHHYLIETNPALTTLGIFYGSDYFLSRIGLDQRRQQVILLGDAFFETRLVQQQILEATGLRFLDGYSTDADQMRGLMDAAAAQAEGLDLALGVALTADQVAALTDDIVWLVEQEVNGQKVMVPQVYLAAGSRKATLKGGSLIAGDTVSLEVGTLGNSGSTISGGTLSAAAGSIVNSGGGTLTGGVVQLAAAGDIRNTGSTISGGQVSLSAGRDIISEAAVQAIGGGETRLQSAAAITATDGLRLSAGRDVTLAASALSSGGDAAISAGRDLNVTTVTTGTSFHNYHLDEETTTHHGSAVAVGGNLQMTAGRDLTVAGSGVAAGGDALLASGGDLSVTAVQDVFRQEIRGSSSNGLLGSSSSRRNEERITSKGSTVAAGGDLALLAGARDLASGASGASGAAGHVSVVGSALVSGKDLSAAAGGNINVTSAVNSRFTSYSKSSSGALGLSSSSKKGGSTSVTRVSSTLAGQNISLEAGQDVNVGASRLAAADTLSLTAREGSVTVMDGQNLSSSWEVSSKTGFGLGGGGSLASIYGTEGKRERSQTSSSVASVLTAGQDVTLSAARDAVVVGSSLSAGGDVRVSAGRDANILGGTESSSHSKESFASGFGLGGSLGLDAGSLFVGYQQTLKGNAEARTTTAGSSLTASGDVRVSAGRNLNMTGSTLTAGQDVNLAAGQDVNLLQATDASSVSAYERTLRAGLSLKLSQNLTGNARKAYADGGEAVDKAREGEVLGAAGKGYDAYSSAQSIANSKATASLSLGISSSWSSSESRSATAVPDKLAAGRDMRISAGRDLSLEGTQAVSGRDMRLEAGRDIDIRAAESREESSSRSGGVDASVGLSASVSKSGYTAGLSASVALKGADVDAEGLRHTNAALTAGQTLSTQSGRDTGVRGANLDGKTVEMNVGRHLVVASLQDGTSARSSSVSAGGSASLSYGSGLSLDQKLNLGGSVADGSGKSVGRQTSIIGSEGLRIVTGRHTHLEGAVLAARNDDLLLDTGSLSFADLVGHTRQTSFSAGLTWGRSGKPGQPGNNAGISDDYGNGSPAKTDTSSAPAAQTQGKKPQTDLYDGAPTWMEDIVDTQQKWGKKWDTFKRDDLHNIAPDKLAYAATSSGQIARATIGAGEIRLRETPGQSLDGLNRDLSQTLLTEDRRETKVELQPLFSYVDKALNPATTTNFFNGLHELGTDPGAFVAGLFGDLFGGKNDAKDATGSGKDATGSGKGGTGNGKDGKDNSAAARAALQALCTDPVGFLKQAFPLLFSAPVSAQDAGR